METKKTNLTNNKFQSQILPIIEKAEVEIKKLINFYALYHKPKKELRDKINGIIMAVAKRLPFSLYDRQGYIDGLKETAEKMIRKFYDVVLLNFSKIVIFLSALNLEKGIKTPMQLYEKVVKDKQFIRVIKENAYQLDMWSVAKGSPNVLDYAKALKEKQKELAATTTTTSVTGKKPISVWQKAEIDLRHEKQMDMIQDLKDRNVKLAWTSTHPDCSKRCEKWQGKLFDLQADSSQLSGHRMNYKVDGHTVYCFKEVISQVDKYGYTNNIIVGFNCRHKLIPYEKGSVPPEEYTEKEIKKEREINANLREMERKIRYYKKQAILYNKTDKRMSIVMKRKAEVLFNRYKRYAERNGFAWYDYRTKV